MNTDEEKEMKAQNRAELLRGLHGAELQETKYQRLLSQSYELVKMEGELRTKLWMAFGIISQLRAGGTLDEIQMEHLAGIEKTLGLGERR